MTDEILDMVGGNSRLAHAARENLRALAGNGSEKVREMASAVLDGASLRELALGETYGREIGSAFDAFWDHYQSMSDVERADLEEGARQRYYGPA